MSNEYSLIDILKRGYNILTESYNTPTTWRERAILGVWSKYRGLRNRSIKDALEYSRKVTGTDRPLTYEYVENMFDEELQIALEIGRSMEKDKLKKKELDIIAKEMEIEKNKYDKILEDDLTWMRDNGLVDEYDMPVDLESNR